MGKVDLGVKYALYVNDGAVVLVNKKLNDIYSVTVAYTLETKVFYRDTAILKEGAQDANNAPEASVEGNHRGSKGDTPRP